VDEDRFTPFHVYALAGPDGFADNVTIPPLHMGPLLVTLTEYVVVTAGVAVGFWAVDENAPAPLQLYLVAPPEGFEVSVTAPPLHMGPLLAGAAVGAVVTVAVVV
jgi:hypothetical protein